jgi:hypothetical protein
LVANCLIGHNGHIDRVDNITPRRGGCLSFSAHTHYAPKNVTPAITQQACYCQDMPTRSSKDHDFTRAALRAVEPTIGEKWDGTPLEKPTKNPAAVALGKLGGAKGGAARAKALSPGERSRIAKIAASARWKVKE